MKALSIQQPWAWLIINAGKDIENRSWSTHFRGDFLIHAGQKVDLHSYHDMREEFQIPELPELLKGGIVGQARLVDCVTTWPSSWFFGEYGFVLADAKPLEFRPVRGQLGFFEVPA